MLQLAEMMICWTALFIISPDVFYQLVLHKEGKFFRRISGTKVLCIFLDTLLNANSHKIAVLFVFLLTAADT